MIERLGGIPRQLTPRERLWIENFHAGETPASLRFSSDYLKTLHSGDKVLEVGCAFGRVANFLVRNKDVVVTGVDINPAEIAAAQEHGDNPNVKFEVMDGTQLEYPDNSFNAVVMSGVIGGVELEVRKELLKEALRVVRPGGTVAVAEFKMNLGDPKRVKKYEDDERETGEWGSRIIKRGAKILFIARHFMEGELEKLFSDTGFSSIELREDLIETAGIVDGIVESRRQYTVWGTKPLEGPLAK